MTPSQPAPILQPTLFQTLDPSQTYSLSSLLQRQAELNDEAAEVLKGDIGVCSFNTVFGREKDTAGSTEGDVSEREQEREGPRQRVYSCRTCIVKEGLDGGGVCFGCSISCHSDHDLVELFEKRSFRCDCPTERFPHHSCSLITPALSSSSTQDQPQASSSSTPPTQVYAQGESRQKQKFPVNKRNRYNHNFSGRFCWCDTVYDPEREVETMVQCLVCEDWYHESHLNLLASTSPTSSSDLSTGAGPETDQDQEPILSEDAYDHLICERCVLARPVLRDYLGRDGFPCLVRSEEGSGWTVEGLLEFDDGEEDEGEEGEGEGDGGEKNSAPEKDGTAEAKETKPSDEPAKVINSTGLGKRPLSPSPSALSPSKKRKTTCTYPTTSRSSALGALITRREAVYLSREKTGKVETVHDSEWKDGRADMFVQDGFRDRWCVCDIHKHQFKQLPFLLKEEQSWPPSSQEDETEGSSSAIPSADSAEAQDILLSNLLQALPRGKTLDAITAFNELSADLITFFRTRTAERRALALADGSGIGEESVISERDIKEFFEDFLQKKQRSRRT